jgi:hypothetical protein
MMQLLWQIGIIGTFVWFAIILGMTPVLVFRRIQMMRGTNAILTKTDMLSLILIDLGIIGVGAQFFKLIINYIQLTHFTGQHDWAGLVLVHLWAGLFAIGLLLRRRILQWQNRMQISEDDRPA